MFVGFEFLICDILCDTAINILVSRCLTAFSVVLVFPYLNPKSIIFISDFLKVIFVTFLYTYKTYLLI